MSLTKKADHISVHHENFQKISVKDKSTLDLSLPSEEEIQRCAARTKVALQKIVDEKLATEVKKKDDVFVQYTGSTVNGEGKTRLIKIVEKELDPMAPAAKFKNNQKTPSLPEENTAAILKPKATPKTQEQQKEWYIPPAISNWKNPNGYTIAIDKRVGAFGGAAAKEATINDNFHKLAESLHQADLKARQDIKARNRLRIKMANKEKQNKQEELKTMALKLRNGRDKQLSTGRSMEIERGLKRRKYVNESEQTNPANELLDARIFTKTARVHESEIYDQPMFKQHEAIQNIYTVKNSANKSLGGGEKTDIGSFGGTIKFTKDKKSRWDD